MALPLFISQPVVYLFYRYQRRKSPIPPIKRELIPYPPHEQAAFDALFSATLLQGSNQLIDYRLPYPKLDFLNYLCDRRGYVAHGSIQPDLVDLQPIRLSKDASEFGNRRQIFCSPDAIWALWFAILDKSKCRLTENGCVRVGSGEKRSKYYHFDLPVACKSDPPFTDGMIYLARAEQFPHRHHDPMLDWLNAEIEEWGSTEVVIPMAKLRVQPSDFPYLDKVQFRL